MGLNCTGIILLLFFPLCLQVSKIKGDEREDLKVLATSVGASLAARKVCCTFWGHIFQHRDDKKTLLVLPETYNLASPSLRLGVTGGYPLGSFSILSLDLYFYS